MNLMYCNTVAILLQSLSKIQKYREVKRAPGGARGPVNSLTVDRQGIDGASGPAGGAFHLAVFLNFGEAL